jgi:hypothetical protein
MARARSMYKVRKGSSGDWDRQVKRSNGLGWGEIVIERRRQ